MNRLPVPRPPEFISLAESCDRLGRHLFGEAWSGQLPEIEEILPFDKAVALQEKRAVIGDELGPHADAAYVDHAMRLEEDTGEVMSEALSDSSWARSIMELSKIDQYLSCHPIDDRSAYEAEYLLYLQSKLIFHALIEALSQGQIDSYYSGTDNREMIDKTKWGAKNVTIDFQSNSAVAGTHNFANVRLNIRQFNAFLRLQTNQTISISNRALEKEATKELVATMESSNGRRQKSEVEAEFLSKFDGLSKRDFGRIWAIACRETGSGWNKGGRPPKS